MTAIQKIVALALFAYGGFFVGYLTSQPSPIKTTEEKPLTDWNKFYERFKENQVYAIVTLKVECDRGYCELFLVDGDKWYNVGRTELSSGCGGKEEERDRLYTFERIGRHLNQVPSDKSKFVALSPVGKVDVTGVKFIYFDKLGVEED